MDRYGIILAGGVGSRLYPATKVISKHLLPIYDKPMIYYPLTTLMLANVRNILLITTPNSLPLYQQLLGDGSKWGIRLNYVEQARPEGIAQALTIGEQFLDGHPSAVILGDNIFYGHSLQDKLIEASKRGNGATLFGYHVKDPSNYGVPEFDEKGNIIDIIEKPSFPKSNYALTGLYFYDHNASKYAKNVTPSNRGELEISDLNKVYLKKQDLKLEIINRGFAWLDAGTPDNLDIANKFIQTIEQRQGLKIGCPEEVAFRKGWISKNDLGYLAKPISNTDYGVYLLQLMDES